MCYETAINLQMCEKMWYIPIVALCHHVISKRLVMGCGCATGGLFLWEKEMQNEGYRDYIDGWHGPYIDGWHGPVGPKKETFRDI